MMPSTPSPIPEMTIIEPGDRGFPDEASGPDVTIKKGKGDMDKTIDGIQKEITGKSSVIIHSSM
jgi:hypothetical protein